MARFPLRFIKNDNMCRSLPILGLRIALVWPFIRGNEKISKNTKPQSLLSHRSFDTRHLYAVLFGVVSDALIEGFCNPLPVT